MFKRTSTLLKLLRRPNSKFLQLLPCSILPKAKFATACTPCGGASPSKGHVPTKSAAKGTDDFYIEQILTGCLAEYSYYIESEGEAAIIDPIKDIEVYLELAKMRGSKIKYILETHFHADFVSGHLELAKETGAAMVFGPEAKAKFEFYLAKDNEVLNMGKVSFEVLHTPGHTMESSCFLLKDPLGKPHSVFSGDTLFIDEVGRPDLASNDKITPADLAKRLYNSIKGKLEVLPDETFVYPGHGAGSPCGKMIGSGDFTTIGEQKKTNYAFQPNLKLEDFVVIATKDLPRPLGYMSYDVALNKGERLVRSEKEIMEKNGLDYVSFKQAIAANPDALILDTRENTSKGVVKGAINIGLNSNFSIYTGTVVPHQKTILLIGDCQGTTEQSVIRLLRIGYDNIIGYLQGGIKTWTENGGEFAEMHQISAEEFKKIYEVLDDNSVIVDLRNKAEWGNGAINSAKLIPLRDLEEIILKKDLDHLKNKRIFLHCRTGPRAFIGQSILAKYGFNDVLTVLGGYNKMCELGFKLAPRTA